MFDKDGKYNKGVEPKKPKGFIVPNLKKVSELANAGSGNKKQD